MRIFSFFGKSIPAGRNTSSPWERLILTRSTELGSAWAGNSVNCVPFRHAAILQHRGADITSFFDAEGQVVIARVQETEQPEKWVLTNDRMPNDAHQAISLGLDAQGLLHLAYGAHNSSLLVRHALMPEIAHGFNEARALNISHIVGSNVPSQKNSSSLGVTYPMFLRLRDELLLLYRYGPHFNGEIRLCRHKGGVMTWVEDTPALISGMSDLWTSGPYLNTPVISEDGRVTLFVIWRLAPAATGAGEMINSGIDAFESVDALRTFRTLHGLDLALPITPTNSDRVISVPLGAQLINQASAAQRPDGQPAVMSYWAEDDGIPQYRMIWLEGGNWRVVQVSCFKTSFRLGGRGTLPLPHSRPELLFDASGCALVIYRSSENGNRLVLTVLFPPHYRRSEACHHVLVDEDLGFYEPVISRDAWRERKELVIYVQRCNQRFGSDGSVDRMGSPARLMVWREEAKPTG